MSLKNAGIAKMLVSRLGIPPSEMILNGPNADRMKRMPYHISARLPNKPEARVIPILALTPADVANAKTIFYVRQTDADYAAATQFEVPDPRIPNPPPWWHKGKTTVTMSIMDMKFLVKTYEEIIGYATRHGYSPTHFVIDAKDINDAIQQFTTYARDHPRFYEDVNVQDILATARTNVGMRAGTRKRKSKFGAQKRKHKSKSQKKIRFSKNYAHNKKK